MDATTPVYTVHPTAEAYRRMTEDELASLASDIAQNGQHDPIVLGRVNGGVATWLVDGRNRLKACQTIGIKPAFETRSFKDEDEVRAFVKSRSERRDLTKGQRAIGLALLYPDTAPGKKGRGSAVTLSESNKVSTARISQARSILSHSRDLALAVRDGSVKFDEALMQAQNASNALKSAEAKLARIQAEDPDLAALVTEERLTLDEAIKTLDNRISETKRQQETATRVLQTIFNALFPRGATPDEWAERIAGDVREQFWTSPDELTHENLRACADVMHAISNRWKHADG